MNTPTLGIVFQIIGTQDQPTPFELGSGGSTYKQARGRERGERGRGRGGSGVRTGTMSQLLHCDCGNVAMRGPEWHQE